MVLASFHPWVAFLVEVTQYTQIKSQVHFSAQKYTRTLKFNPILRTQEKKRKKTADLEAQAVNCATKCKGLKTSYKANGMSTTEDLHENMLTT